MPNHALSVFKQLREKAEERGKEIGTFIQRGTTFQNPFCSVRVQENRILYQVMLHTRTGEEEHIGGFPLTDRARASALITLLARAHKSTCKKVQREP